MKKDVLYTEQPISCRLVTIFLCIFSGVNYNIKFIMIANNKPVALSYEALIKSLNECGPISYLKENS